MSFFAGPTPSPSPPSSPASAFVDSSPPPSSPRTPSSGRESSIDASPNHPFSASTHRHERLVTPPLTPEHQGRSFSFRVNPVKRQRLTTNDGHAEKDDVDVFSDYPASFMPSKVTSAEDIERDIWEEAIFEALQSVSVPVLSVTLNDRNLTHVPPSIAELDKRVVFNEGCGIDADSTRLMSRVATEAIDPARTAQRVRSLKGVQSASSRVFGASRRSKEKGQIDLYLANNRISALPNEFFTLSNVVVLSLRGNQLKEISPLICQMTSLENLNVAFNSLRFLPAELMTMQLKQLVVEPNPFLPPPAEVPKSGRLASNTVYTLTRVTSLKELCLRTLLRPCTCSNHAGNVPGSVTRTVLEDVYGYPLTSDWDLSTSLECLLSSCLFRANVQESTPSSMAVSRIASSLAHDASQTRNLPCISTCTSPVHNIIRYGEAYRRPVFVGHAEERVTWEGCIAGVKVANEPRIPLLWRGCSRGCLDYLDGQDAAGDDGFEDFGAANVRMEVDVVGGASATVGNVQFSSEGFEWDDD